MSRPGVQHCSASTTSSVRGGEASKPLGEAEEMVQAAEAVAVRWETMGRVHKHRWFVGAAAVSHSSGDGEAGRHRVRGR
jgi:hypothetical protein